MINATMSKFGFPDTLVRDYRHWSVLLRPAQATLGSLVMVCRDPAERFSAITPDAFAEMATVTREIEDSLYAFRPFDKINYLMLMMVDPDVHFHVLPRYAEAQVFAGVVFEDPGWPAVPDLSAAVTPEPELRARLIAALRQAWVTA